MNDILTATIKESLQGLLSIATINKIAPVVAGRLEEMGVALTADVVEVKHGYWFISEYEYFTCSLCGGDVTSGADSTHQAKQFLNSGLTFPYCPRCGAKMDIKERFHQEKE